MRENQLDNIERLLDKAYKELSVAEARVKELEDRYVFHENQMLCVGDSGRCDGDLEGTEHEENCPARAKDLVIRPYLYDKIPNAEQESNA